MPRAIWSGAIGFGLVNVPVKLYSATQSKDISFHQLEEKSGKRIENKRVATGTRREVEYDEIVKGYEMSKGKYVVVTPDELEQVAPTKTNIIEIEDFVSLDEIDPIYFEKSYYLGPAERSAKPYALLREALDDSGRVGIGSFVMRTKEYLACIRPSGKLLVLETMYFADEIRDVKDIDPPASARLSPKEKQIANRLIDSLTVKWDPDRYHDSYRERVIDLIENKAEGKEVVVEEEPERETPKDLLAALEASLTEARGTSAKHPHRRRKSTKATKKTAAKTRASSSSTTRRA